MLRLAAVRSLLAEEIAGFRRGDGDLDPEALLERIDDAIKRAKLAVAVDWFAIVGLFLLQERGLAFLAVPDNEHVVFAIGVVVVAVHSGYRLAQMGTLRKVRRAVEELPAGDG